MGKLQGLNGKKAVGRCGGFDHGEYEYISNTSIALNTCMAQGLSLFEFGVKGSMFGSPSIGWNNSSKIIDESWTGMGLDCQLADKTPLRVDYRTTVPGALYTVQGNRFGWDWSVPGSPGSIVLLENNKECANKMDILDCGQIFYAKTPMGPVVFSFSQPLEKLESISWEHWRFNFKNPGVTIMVTPLLSEDDIPDEKSLKNWIGITENPPLYCSETFDKSDDGILIQSNFTSFDESSTDYAPLPPTSLLASNNRGLSSSNDHEVLLQTIHGPFAVVKDSGGSYEQNLNTKWMGASLQATTLNIDINEKLPFELAYAGDATWDENSVMDKFLSWRLWAQVHSLLSQDMKDELIKRVPIPTKEDFSDSLMTRLEPISQQKWKLDKTIFTVFDEDSAASYDIDWYNGLTLSGLRRAGDCSDEEVASQAKSLAKEIKIDRQDMIAYYSIFSDWALGAPWTDARGEVFNFDCAHNGLEGILAEREFCLWEGDNDGAAYMEYLAAKMSLIFVISEVPCATNIGEGTSYGTQVIYEGRFGVNVLIKGRAPYNLAGDFPEFSALLKNHGPFEKLKQQSADYLEEGTRYQDWLAFYVGEECAAELRKGKDEVGAEGFEGNQEAREQASVFYHVSPNMSLRLMILEESPKAIEDSYKLELPLLARIYCQAGMRLKED
ncbi:MAG: hypothetical protein COA79_23065 [Planctomycetota bacterium]|nr:MAG: hypothetical protein COA79_23065 [Planctomycetota bacterium]